jgi:hypothetical protein
MLSGSESGDLTLHNLHLKKSAVEKYNLPVEVVEGEMLACNFQLDCARSNSDIPPTLLRNLRSYWTFAYYDTLVLSSDQPGPRQDFRCVLARQDERHNTGKPGPQGRRAKGTRSQAGKVEEC